MQKSCEENEGKSQNMPKAEEDRPLEDVPFTPFGPQAPKTLSWCPRGSLVFRENV